LELYEPSLEKFIRVHHACQQAFVIVIGRGLNATILTIPGDGFKPYPKLISQKRRTPKVIIHNSEYRCVRSKSARGLAQSKTLREVHGLWFCAPSSWSAVALYRFGEERRLPWMDINHPPRSCLL